MDHTIGMKIVIEGEKGGTVRGANGSSMNFAMTTIPGSQNGLFNKMKNDLNK